VGRWPKTEKREPNGVLVDAAGRNAAPSSRLADRPEGTESESGSELMHL